MSCTDRRTGHRESAPGRSRTCTAGGGGFTVRWARPCPADAWVFRWRRRESNPQTRRFELRRFAGLRTAPCLVDSALDGIRTRDLLRDGQASTPGCSARACMLVAQAGFEPAASSVLSRGGLPVAYRAEWSRADSNRRSSPCKGAAVAAGLRDRVCCVLVVAGDRAAEAGIEPTRRRSERLILPLDDSAVSALQVAHPTVARGEGFEPSPSASKAGGLPLADPRSLDFVPLLVPCGREVRLARLEAWGLCRSAKGTCMVCGRRGSRTPKAFARPLSRRLPSPVGLSFRKAAVAGIEPAT